MVRYVLRFGPSLVSQLPFSSFAKRAKGILVLEFETGGGGKASRMWAPFIYVFVYFLFRFPLSFANAWPPRYSPFPFQKLREHGLGTGRGSATQAASGCNRSEISLVLVCFLFQEDEEICGVLMNPQSG